jgi:3-hydroxybutyryl-CoA dehydrogenase
MVYKLEDLEQVGVVGAGTMGAGIAQVAAMSGYDVVLNDIEEAFLESGFESIDDSLRGLQDKDEISEEDATAARSRITGTTTIEDLSDCQVVIEAAPEELDVKQRIFESLDDVTHDSAILATNTSTLSVTAIASATSTPVTVVGIHFMNPVPVMSGVEIVVGEKTSDQTVTLAHQLAERLGKETWEAADTPGFVTNRILMPWINEGIRAYHEGVASKEDIDTGMTLGTNVPMGPLELADHIGLDVCLQATRTLHENLGDRYKPAYLLTRKVNAGDLGKKTGSGFYEYHDE